jgi:hypothetical protein
MSIGKLIRRDRRVRRLRGMIKSGTYNVNIAGFIKELESSHTAKLTRRLSVEDVLTKFQTRFLRAVLQNQANRSRFVEIKVRCFVTKERLDRHLTKLRQHLMSRYSGALRNSAGTQEERRSIVNNELAEAMELQQSIKTVMDIADLIINDVDQAGWDMKRIIDAMTLIQERGKQL